MKILYEDNHIIVVVKPENVPTQGDSSGDFDMLSVVRDYIKVKYEKPGNVYVGLVHRLDRPVGGVMVFAKTSKAAGRLTDEFKKKSARKKYVAIVEGKTERNGTLSCYMRKNETTFSAELCSANDSGAKSATLDYSLIAYRNGYSLLDIDLHSGRHHQIRFQLANEGFPIYGDHRYNAKFINKNSENIALFAYSLSFSHPTTHETLYYSEMPSSSSMFDMFKDEIAALCANVTPVYIDDNIILLDKPVGISVACADEPNKETLESRILRAFPSAKPIHRLDATTCGLVFFSRSDAGNAALTDAFSRSSDAISIDKYYLCKVFGELCDSGTISVYIDKNAKAGHVAVYDYAAKSAKYAETEYKPLKTTKNGDSVITTLEVHLVTGRTHQIRASLAHIGFPVVGDDKYGDREKNRVQKCQIPALISYRAVLHASSDSPLFALDGAEFVSFCKL